MTNLPSNLIVPFVGVDFDNTAAFQTPAGFPVKSLLIGQKLAAGAGSVETPILITNADTVLTQGAEGSQIHKMAQAYFKNNVTTETWMIMLSDASTSTAATHARDITGTATASGTLVFYIDGRRIQVAVAVGDTGAQVASYAVIDINAETDLPCTAAFDTNTLTLTMKNKGLAAGDLNFKLSTLTEDEIPAGITVGSLAETAGTVDPDLQDAIDAIGATWFNVIAQPYSCSANMGAMEAFLAEQITNLVNQGGVCYQGKRDTLGNLVTFATNAARNSEQMQLLDTQFMYEQSVQAAAAKAGATAASIEADVGEPLHRMTLQGLTVVDEGDRRTVSERNTLAQNGVASFSYDVGVQTYSTVTMYLKNSTGAADTSYQFENYVFILLAARYRFIAQILSKYPRARLADNADRIKAGLQVMTPNIGKAEALSWFDEGVKDGLFEDKKDEFKKYLVVQRSSSNKNRMDWLLPPDLIDQFIVGSGTIQFR